MTAKRILIVEDERPLAHALDLKLKHEGFDTTVANNGKEGFDLIVSGDFDIVLLDMMMPVMDGAATIRALVRLNPAVKIIAASGLSTKGGEAESASSGAVRRFLPKPYTASTMLHAFYEVLHSDLATEQSTGFQFHEME